jgi:hypothetical protein
VRVARAKSASSYKWPSGWQPDAAGGLVLEYFLGTVWHADTGDVLDAVEALIDQGHVDPVTIREVSWELWGITPFYCPECHLNYCALDWEMRFSVNQDSHDCIIGTCPDGTGTCSADRRRLPQQPWCGRLRGEDGVEEGGWAGAGRAVADLAVADFDDPPGAVSAQGLRLDGHANTAAANRHRARFPQRTACSFANAAAGSCARAGPVQPSSGQTVRLASSRSSLRQTGR